LPPLSSAPDQSQPASREVTHRITIADVLRRDRLPMPEEVGAPPVAAGTRHAEERTSYPLPTPESLHPKKTDAELLREPDEITTGPPAGAKRAHKKRHINSLPSAPKIDLTRAPDTSLFQLPPQQLEDLVRAMGGGELRAPGRARDDQVDLLFTRLSNIDFDQFNVGLDWAGNIARCGVFDALPPEQQERLKQAAEITHLSIVESSYRDQQTGELKRRMDFYFGASQNKRDDKQHVKTMFGGVGEVYKAVGDAAELIAEALRSSPQLQVGRIMGISMGGGSAQAFAAGLQSRVKLPEDPVLVVFDPQLLNNAQAKHAIKNGTHDYDYGKLRGVAITLDYEAERHKGLMNIMKGVGRYKSPGLVQLRLGLKDDDDYGQSRPRPEPPLGYHSRAVLYESAMDRFTTRPEPE
jgi:hypothetical protein